MVFPRPILAVVFDMDGLLIDSEALYRDALLTAAAAIGKPLPIEIFHTLIGAPITHNRQRLLDHFGPDYDIEALFADASRRFHEEVDYENILKAGVTELLDRLEALGIPRAIATSSPHDAVDRHLGPSGLKSRFQAIIARGDYAQGKPAPDPFLTAAKALGVAPESCLALEDSHNGVRAAHAAGMMTVMVPDLLEPNDEMHEKCVVVAESLHRVLALIDAQHASLNA
jgi:HAD superfamily hydrolase (TIGR01509 family)